MTGPFRDMLPDGLMEVRDGDGPATQVRYQNGVPVEQAAGQADAGALAVARARIGSLESTLAEAQARVAILEAALAGRVPSNSKSLIDL